MYLRSLRPHVHLSFISLYSRSNFEDLFKLTSIVCTWECENIAVISVIECLPQPLLSLTTKRSLITMVLYLTTCAMNADLGLGCWMLLNVIKDPSILKKEILNALIVRQDLENS